MIQNTFVSIAAVVALLLGVAANYHIYGWLIAGSYAIMLLTALYFIIYQIRCVVRGYCITTAWWNALLGIFMFGSIGLYYYKVLKNDVELTTLSTQPIFASIPIYTQLPGKAQKYIVKHLFSYTDKVEPKAKIVLGQPMESLYPL
jgi:hypothetical protein